MQNPPVGVCVEAACELYVAALLLVEFRFVIVNSVTRNSPREMAASAPKPVSTVVSAVVAVKVDVIISGSCVEMTVQVERLISVMIE